MFPYYLKDLILVTVVASAPYLTEFFEHRWLERREHLSTIVRQQRSLRSRRKISRGHRIGRWTSLISYSMCLVFRSVALNAENLIYLFSFLLFYLQFEWK